MILLQVNPTIIQTVPTWVIVLQIVLYSFVTLFTAAMTYMIARVNKRQAEAAVKVDEVQKNLQIQNKSRTVQLNEIQETGTKVHVLVNNARGVTLRALSVALRFIAKEHPSESNEAAAKEAEQASTDHEEMQKLSDKI